MPLASPDKTPPPPPPPLPKPIVTRDRSVGPDDAAAIVAVADHSAERLQLKRGYQQTIAGLCRRHDAALAAANQSNRKLRAELNDLQARVEATIAERVAERTADFEASVADARAQRDALASQVDELTHESSNLVGVLREAVAARDEMLADAEYEQFKMRTRAEMAEEEVERLQRQLCASRESREVAAAEASAVCDVLTIEIGLEDEGLRAKEAAEAEAAAEREAEAAKEAKAAKEAAARRVASKEAAAAREALAREVAAREAALQEEAAREAAVSFAAAKEAAEKEEAAAREAEEREEAAAREAAALLEARAREAVAQEQARAREAAAQAALVADAAYHGGGGQEPQQKPQKQPCSNKAAGGTPSKQKRAQFTSGAHSSVEEVPRPAGSLPQRTPSRGHSERPGFATGLFSRVSKQTPSPRQPQQRVATPQQQPPQKVRGTPTKAAAPTKYTDLLSQYMDSMPKAR